MYFTKIAPTQPNILHLEEHIKETYQMCIDNPAKYVRRTKSH